MRAFLVCFVALTIFLGCVRTARADVPKGTAFALIVTNNRSPRLSRPDLRYADDDGAKYYDVFRMIAPESNVALLTKFDRDTERLFPHLAGKERPPSKAHVQSAARDLAAKMRSAASAGPVDFYFVFAGHGDVDGGKGFLELEDGAFTSEDLAELLKSMPATRSHVILDSCNSFFVVNARKPGGRHFVTSAEAAKSLGERLPNVGVFLSTSAEAAVYEWSELQSGVFSHAVRSGLSGAADADGNGRVSYDELRAFVNIASKDIKNPNFRPQVFARAPGGRGDEALLKLTGARASRVRLEQGQQRLTVRDPNELRWLDVHKEAGSSLTLWLPPSIAKDANVEELDAANGIVLRRRRLQLVEDGGESESMLAALPTGDVRADARGPDEMFRSLFSRPFGSTSFSQYQRELATEEPAVFGISTDDARRMHDLLEQAAEQAKTRRIVGGGIGAGGLGVVMLAGGVYAYTQSKTELQQGLSVTLGVLGGGLITTGVLATVITSKEEDIFASYVDGLRRNRNPMDVVAKTERELFALAEEYRSHRTRMRWLGVGMATLFAALGTSSVIQAETPDARLFSGLFYGALFVESGFLVGWTFVKYPTEETAAIWSKDPGIERLRAPEPKVHIRPELGLGTIGFSASF